MPIYNFKCPYGHVKADIYFSLKDLPQTIGCHCGTDMVQDFSNHTVGYSDSGYPYTDPQTGLTYTSANDKKQKLKILGLEESSWKEGGASLSDTHKHEAWKQEKAGQKLLENSYWLDNESSIEKQTDELLKKEGDKIAQKSLQKG